VLAVAVVILSLALGALLAQRYTILALPPATFVAVAVAVASNLMSNGSWSTIAIAIVAALGLQIGYFIGMVCANLLPARVQLKLSNYTHSTSPKIPHDNALR
jgi:uncharacterized membrane protein